MEVTKVPPGEQGRAHQRTHTTPRLDLCPQATDTWVGDSPGRRRGGPGTLPADVGDAGPGHGGTNSGRSMTLCSRTGWPSVVDETPSSQVRPLDT